MFFWVATLFLVPIIANIFSGLFLDFVKWLSAEG